MRGTSRRVRCRYRSQPRRSMAGQPRLMAGNPAEVWRGNDIRPREQIDPFEVIGNGHLEGTPVRFGSPFFIDGARVRVGHGRICIGDRRFEALAMVLLRRAPYDRGHVGGACYECFPALGNAEDHVAQPAFDACDPGGRVTFAIGCLLSSGVAQGSSRMLKGGLTGLYSACLEPVLVLYWSRWIRIGLDCT